MGDKPSVFFYGEKTVFTPFEGKFYISGVDIGKLILLFIIVLILTIFLRVFLMTQVGLSLRATGDNEAMVRSSSINTDAMKILGFALCNLIVAFSGAVYAQYNMTATHGMGTGMLVLGLPAIYLKLFSAVIVVVAISIPLIKPTIVRWRKIHAGN